MSRYLNIPPSLHHWSSPDEDECLHIKILRYLLIFIVLNDCLNYFHHKFLLLNQKCCKMYPWVCLLKLLSARSPVQIIHFLITVKKWATFQHCFSCFDNT